LFPETDANRAKTSGKFVLRQRGKLAESMNAPFVQDVENMGKAIGLFLGGLHQGRISKMAKMFNRTYKEEFFFRNGWFLYFVPLRNRATRPKST
jgi:hypothetical protein